MNDTTDLIRVPVILLNDFILFVEVNHTKDLVLGPCENTAVVRVNRECRDGSVVINHSETGNSFCWLIKRRLDKILSCKVDDITHPNSNRPIL
jgi:hypothetical protein